MAGDNSESTTLTSRPLEEELYFHGELGREDVGHLMERDGDFLVRLVETQGKKRTAITVMKGTAKHFIVNRSREGYYYLEKKVFESVNDLIRYHMGTKEALTAKSGAQLLNPVLREINERNIEQGKQIGAGAFGYVYEGTLGPERIAIKTCKESLSKEDRNKFLNEARIMRAYDHPNIVRLLGVAQNPLRLIMEYVEGGSLLDHLRKRIPTPTQASKITFALHAAKGMEYLESQKCIHRDLAARNCLLTPHNTVKISDFGLSRNKEFYKSRGEKKLPVKWMAPEVITKSIYSSRSDTWSFGILLWEMFSNGTSPYGGMRNEEVWKRVGWERYRIKPPDKTPPPILELFNKCLDHNPQARPRFNRIRQDLERISNAKYTHY